MTFHPLSEQFHKTQSNLDLGTRRKVAVAAHLEVRSAMRLAEPLIQRGLEDVLIGSYQRRTGIWPGKDVDVLAKLTSESIDTIEPSAAYDLFFSVLSESFPGRVQPQDRSVKIEYRPSVLPDDSFVRQAAALLSDDDAIGLSDGFEFSVDVVPAVHLDDMWGIPDRSRENWTRTAAAERWTRTNPEKLTELTQQLNAKTSVGGQGAYVPTVKMIRQIRRAHLGDAKPGGFFLELLVYEGFTSRSIEGASWAEITASTLRYVADRLLTVPTSALCDPVLGQPYDPQPSLAALNAAAALFAQLAQRADVAITAEKCEAAAAWRHIFGSNTKVNGPVFELPSGCRSDGTPMPAFSTSQSNPVRGTDEAHGFG